MDSEWSGEAKDAPVLLSFGGPSRVELATSSPFSQLSSALGALDTNLRDPFLHHDPATKPWASGISTFWIGNVCDVPCGGVTNICPFGAGFACLRHIRKSQSGRQCPICSTLSSNGRSWSTWWMMIAKKLAGVEDEGAIHSPHVGRCKYIPELITCRLPHC